jgi:hypothetical protein
LLAFTIVACAFSAWFFFAASAQATALWHDTVYVCGQLGVPAVITGDNPQMGYHEFSGLPPSLTCRWDSPEGVSMDFVHTDPSADEDYGRGFVALWVAAGLAMLVTAGKIIQKSGWVVGRSVGRGLTVVGREKSVTKPDGAHRRGREKPRRQKSSAR